LVRRPYRRTEAIIVVRDHRLWRGVHTRVHTRAVRTLGELRPIRGRTESLKLDQGADGTQVTMPSPAGAAECPYLGKGARPGHLK
jgi:hypothetical protein